MFRFFYLCAGVSLIIMGLSASYGIIKATETNTIEDCRWILHDEERKNEQR